MNNTTPTLEETRKQVIEEMNARRIDHKTYTDSNWLLAEYEKQLVTTAKREALMEVRDYVQTMPAFTSTSDKTMSKVSDQAKKPAYGTNYLERETLLTHLKSELNSGAESK
jgi:hypothetical protein